MDTPTPFGLDQQQAWGGSTFGQLGEGSSDNDGCTTLVGNQEPVASIPTSSQAHMIASNSDDLFYPTSSGPSVHPYTLPTVPVHDPFTNRAYISPSCQHPRPSHIPVNREHLSHPPFQPPYFTSTSYNNPSFTIPPESPTYFYPVIWLYPF